MRIAARFSHQQDLLGGFGDVVRGVHGRVGGRDDGQRVLRISVVRPRVPHLRKVCVGFFSLFLGLFLINCFFPQFFVIFIVFNLFNSLKSHVQSRI